jgi:hypothetical protein
MENTDMTTPAADWETDEWSKFEDEIIAKQNMMAEHKLVWLICRIITGEEGKEIMDEAVLLAIACLLGGNEQIQNKFLEYMQEDHTNGFLVKLKNLIFKY